MFCVGRRAFARSTSISRVRYFRVTQHRLVINPMLPFDVLEDLNNDELEENNEKLKKQTKRLVKQRKKIEKILKEDLLEEEEEDKGKGKEADKVDLKNLKQKEGEEKEKELPKNQKDSNDETKLLDNVKSKEDIISTKETSKTNNGDDLNNKNSNILNSKEKEPNDVAKAVNQLTTVVTENFLGGNNSGSSPNDKDPEDLNKKKEEKKEDEEIEEEVEEETEETKSKWKEYSAKFIKFAFKCFETMAITFSSVAMLGVAGILYHQFYGAHVLQKIDEAFNFGDPVFQLAVSKKTDKYSEGSPDESKNDISQFWAQRPQQPLLDDIIAGKIVGRYFLVIGEKGTGKTSLLLEAMKKINGYNVAMFDAHADPEIFRLRLGKALNFAYSEDYIGSLFSIRGPRDTTALLDIERAFGKLEELAMERIVKNDGKPLVLIINNSHLIKENEDGTKLIELLQQKAEGLSGTGLATIIFNSDDYWVYEKLKKLGTRLEVINVHDFSRTEAIQALYFTREKFFPRHKYPELVLNDTLCNQIYDLIGGRPQHISQVARHRNIIQACNEIIDREKTWFLNQCGLLGAEMDDDVMESGKFSTSAMLLMREFVEMDRERFDTLFNEESSSTKEHNELCDHHLPELPLWRSRQIMTRNDYIQDYDNLNIFTIDSESRVRADSVPMMRAFHEIASQPQFDELLQETIQRVADIESLGRTRELVAKDLFLGGKYQLKKADDKFVLGLKIKNDKKDNDKNLNDDDDDDDEDAYLEDISRNKKWWRKRMLSFNESYNPQVTNNSVSDLSRNE